MEEITNYLKICNAVREYGKRVIAEEVVEDNSKSFEIAVEGLSLARLFSFYWTSEDTDIHYSSKYEFRDGVIDKFDIYNNILKRLQPPFVGVRMNDEKTTIELVGLLNKNEVTEEKVISVLTYLDTNMEVVGKLSTLSALYGREESPKKHRCDKELLRTYKHFQKYGDGTPLIIHRLLGVTTDELGANIKTLLDIGLIKEDRYYDYVIDNTKVAKINNDIKLMKIINKEIKKHERQNIS